ALGVETRGEIAAGLVDDGDDVVAALREVAAEADEPVAVRPRAGDLGDARLLRDRMPAPHAAHFHQRRQEAPRQREGAAEGPADSIAARGSARHQRVDVGGAALQGEALEHATAAVLAEAAREVFVAEEAKN